MAITRRQFVTTLGALAAAMGVGQADISKLTEAFAHDKAAWSSATGWIEKPKVVWVHGAECTGCSTSLLSLFEDARGEAIVGSGISTVAALDLAVGGTGSGAKVLSADVPGGHPFGHRTLSNSASVTGCDFDGVANSSPYTINIADVLIDFIDLQYHETVMGMGGDLAYQWLADNMYGAPGAFVLVVEGAVQPKDGGGYWNVTGDVKWCSIGMDDKGAGATTWASQPTDSKGEHSFDDVVGRLANQANCAAVVSIGQCACYGGYPACESPVLKKDARGIAAGSANMTGALGVKDFLHGVYGAGISGKVINVPGCPANPWWFVLTVVAWLVDFVNPDTLHILDSGHAIIPSAVDSQGRLKAVFGTPIHGPNCPRYQDFLNGKFCTHPGTAPAGSVRGGCLQLIGCKGPSAKGLCNVHGWNSMQPNNDPSWEGGFSAVTAGGGSACPMAGAPCMACTEKGYPDSFVPFVAR